MANVIYDTIMENNQFPTINIDNNSNTLNDFDDRFDKIKTNIIRLNISSPLNSRQLTVFDGEDVHLSIAESALGPAVSIGTEGAALFTEEKTLLFERTPGLPLELYALDNFFIILDADSNISWHDNTSGKLLALFRLYDDQWLLQTPERMITGNWD